MTAQTKNALDSVFRVVTPILSAGVLGLVALVLSLQGRVITLEAAGLTTKDFTEHKERTREFELGVTDKFNAILISIEKLRGELPIYKIEMLEKRIDKLEANGGK